VTLCQSIFLELARTEAIIRAAAPAPASIAPTRRGRWILLLKD